MLQSKAEGRRGRGDDTKGLCQIAERQKTLKETKKEVKRKLQARVEPAILHTCH